MKKKKDDFVKFFYHNSFDQGKRIDLISEMPELDQFQKNLVKVKKARANKINPEMLPCYESPLLTFAQEQYLFAKMNYYKFRANQIISQKSEAKIKLFKYFMNKAKEIRNQIAESNFRLATQIMKHKNSITQEISNTELMLSDAYFDVFKAVDYFNWTLGHRFSTYATWVCKKNFFRDLKQKSIQVEKLTYLDENKAEMIEDRGTDYDDEKSHLNHQALIKKLIGIMVNENIGTDRIRQAYVLEKYFGVNGRDKMTLEQISDEIGVTKERVRQLKERGLEWIRQRVEQMGITMD
jgi:RNA polymerase sigma factor (sigma-70 family)